LAHLFSDDTTDVNGTFAELFELNMKPHDFKTDGNFTDRVDLSVAGMVQDCAECHVGGGAMEYVPAIAMDNRTPLRKIYTDTINGYPPLTSGNYTAFNWFIDTYDVNNDGNRTMALEMDWRNNGVLEMDCLLCHLEGYDYKARRQMLREARFDASRAVGAGVAAPNTAILWGTGKVKAPLNYGTTVVYNDMVDMVSVNATFSDTILLNIKASPPSENCAFCHANFPGVDWKKRGDSWRNERTDAHYVLNCMGCHEGKVGSKIGTSTNATDGFLSPDLGQCDPARGDAPYSSVWGPTKNTVKTCDDCHLRAGFDSDLQEYSPDYGAPDPTGTHEYYGLTAKICQNGTDGIVDASHLDIIDCAACHVRKAAGEAWNTGGAMVDATGEDHVHRMADHENNWVLRNMEKNLCYTWWHGKIVPASVLTTIFWRDNDDTCDVNNDYESKGMDTPLTTHILATNLANSSPWLDHDYWMNMVLDNAGNIDDVVIQERIDALNTDLTSNDNCGGGVDIRLCALAVPFRVTHNVSPASYALGHACDDCHNAAAGGMFNGEYKLQGDEMTLSYNGTGHGAGSQVCPTYTKVKSPYDRKTDFHFNLKIKSGDYSIPVVPFSGGSDNLTSVQRYELLYDGNFSATGTIKGVDGNTYTDRDGGSGWIAYLNSISASTCNCYPDANASVCDNNSTAHGLRGYGIGCNCGNSSAPYFHGDVSSVTGITYGVNATATSDYPHCVAPSPWHIYEVKVCTPICFEADEECPGTEYYWNFNDASGFEEGTQFSAKTVGLKVSHEFRKLGIFKVVLTVKNLYGNVDSEMILVNVVK
jgi:hypothetical protein